MQAKLEAACDAVGRGVPRVVIAAGAQTGILQDILSGASAGTAIHAD
jgi:acetylglutamate kinase